MKRAEQIAALVDLYRAADGPVVFKDACDTVGFKYAEDAIVAFHAYVHTEQARRLKAGTKVACIWTGDKA